VWRQHCPRVEKKRPHVLTQIQVQETKHVPISGT
jgi:hypothetical protein